MENKSSLIKNNYIVLKYVFKFCPMLLFFTAINIVATVFKSLYEVLLISKAITLVSNNSDFNTIYNGLLVYIIVIAICACLNTIYENFIIAKYRLIYQKNMQYFLFSKVKNIDYGLYDDPSFYDRFSRALRDSIWRGYGTFTIIKNFITSIVVAICLGTYIIITDPLLIFIILIHSFISVVFISKMNVLRFQYFKNTEKEHRYMWYVNRTFYRQENAAELKTTNVNNLLIEKYEENVNEVNKKTIILNKKLVFPEIMLTISSNIISQLGTYILLMVRVAKGLMNIALFTSTVNATSKFQNKVQEIVNLITNLKNNSLYIEDLIWILEYTPDVEKKKEYIDINFNKLEINNVSFSYPLTSKNVLNKIDIEALKGKRIAIVGRNGSGKTTLMKLLLGFYKVNNGNIYINDYSYNDLDSKQIRDEYSIVFQDFNLYAVTIAENVLMRRVNSNEDEIIVWEALKSVGLYDKVKSLKKGIYTEVTREFDRDGMNFSGGERQRIAIARVFASNKDIYILDEPTSSLDPLAEEKINKLILEQAKDKTMFIIAHRLSTVVDADMICLIDNGEIVEKGTHEELLKLNGMYANMFNTQKHLYEVK